MPYMTSMAAPRYHQISWDELFDFTNMDKTPTGPIGHIGDTRTIWKKDENLSRLYRANHYKYVHCARMFREFVKKYEQLYNVERTSLYHHYEIPKRSGGRRPIDEPLPELMTALRELVSIFKECGASYHTAAFAYIEHRSCRDVAVRHANANNNYKLKIDLSNFFGSTTKEFVMSMLKVIYPFNKIMQYDYDAVDKAIDLCFLNGGLPQGTPISPMLTNLIMIPIDHWVSKNMRDFNGQSYTYTRYADDMYFSAKHQFKFMDIVNFMRDTFTKFGAPYQIKPEKTIYGSFAGQNFILGLMVTKDHKITVGHRRKDVLRAQMANFIKDERNGNRWDVNDVQGLQGNMAYVRQIEPSYMDGLVEHYNRKFNVDIHQLIVEALHR